MKINKDDAGIQGDNLKVLGFVTDVARRNLILSMLIVSWIISFICAYKWAACEKENDAVIERLTNKYETKIDLLYNKITELK